MMDHRIDDPTLGEKVRFLAEPASYPGREDHIEVVETHFSWVFLTRHLAYKLKKPVHGKGFDFRTVDARRRNALAELTLNRRLAPHVYLDIVALTRRPEGGLGLGGDGGIIDWLIRMTRLDCRRMLDRRLTAGNWRYGEIEALAYRLAAFFASARHAKPAPAAHIAHLRRELDLARAVLVPIHEFGLGIRAARTVRRLDAFLARNGALLRRRAKRFLIDGHGDLRPEHVYLHGTPQIIDCLEYRADLRRLDPVSEIAFLELECDRVASSPIGRRLAARYRERTGDCPPEELLAFYRALNALIRARLAVEHIAEPGVRSRIQWIVRAASYLDILEHRAAAPPSTALNPSRIAA